MKHKIQYRIPVYDVKHMSGMDLLRRMEDIERYSLESLYVIQNNTENIHIRWNLNESLPGLVLRMKTYDN